MVLLRILSKSSLAIHVGECTCIEYFTLLNLNSKFRLQLSLNISLYSVTFAFNFLIKSSDEAASKKKKLKPLSF